MGLKEILEALEQEAIAMEKEIHERALAQAERIRAEASSRAAEAKQLLLEEEKKKVEQEARNIINAAEAEARKILSRAKEQTFVLVRKKLEELIAKDPELKKKLFRLALKDALRLLDGQVGHVKLEVAASDVDVVEETLKSLGVELEVLPANGLKNGFVVSARDGTIAIKSTPALIAERLMKLYVEEIARRLLG
jgi:vacuolar-type H+-ATPase subunit E/Vma4